MYICPMGYVSYGGSVQEVSDWGLMAGGYKSFRVSVWGGGGGYRPRWVMFQ